LQKKSDIVKPIIKNYSIYKGPASCCSRSNNP